MNYAQIGDVIVDKIVELLTAELTIGVDKSEPIHVAHIQGGRLQADPIEKGSWWGHSIEVHLGDPTDEEWIDECVVRGDRYIGGLPIAEVGGDGYAGVFWWRRGVVEISNFFIITQEHTRDEARQIAMEVRRRVEKILGEHVGANFVGLTDTDTEESVIFFMPTHSKSSEGGGPPNQWIWRSCVRWQAMTGRA